MGPHLQADFCSKIKAIKPTFAGVPVGRLSTAYRLQRPLLLRWQALAGQVGSDVTRTSHLAQRVRAVLPDVLAVYPDADVEPVHQGLRLLPSKPPVPKSAVNGLRLVQGRRR